MEKKKHNKKKIIIISSSIGGFLLVVILAFFIYLIPYNHATDNALNYMKDSDKSEVIDTDSYTIYKSKNSSVENGLIFYPGGKVGDEAYAPLLRDLSDSGLTSILVKMPFHLAIFKSSAADGKQELVPEIKNWYIGGHSLGGLMASSYLSKHNTDYKGLFLFASYTNTDLSSYTNLNTLSFLASNDEVLNYSNYSKYKNYLPNLTEYTISGGIHSYFGDYGIQKGDGTPTITVEEQRSQIVNQIVTFLKI